MEKHLDKPQELALYRIAQELINNIIKHAQATTISLQLIHHGDTVMMMVEDNGVGFDQEEGAAGIGLQNINSRATLLNGNVTIDSEPGSGTLVTVEIPVLV